MGILYNPPDGIAGDVIPFYWNGQYHLYYINPNTGPGAGWFHATTRDLVDFCDHGEALAGGGTDAQDRDIWTGSVFECNGVFHIFYTGHNSDNPAAGKPDQVIMHATSTDLMKWSKDSGFAIEPPLEQGYEISAWRDAFVFRNEEAGEYWMLVTARQASEIPLRKRGCIAVLGSSDLRHWDLREPLWAPQEYDTLECPDLFKIGDWWYLLYSTYTGRWTTHYRMSRSTRGPWTAPPEDTFDGDGFYAAKTAGHGARRFVIGWVGERTQRMDESPFAWGGTVVGHELAQQPDGTLGVRIPESVASSFTGKHYLSPRSVIGEWRIMGNEFSTESRGRFSLIGLGGLAPECLVETTVTFQEGTANCGLVLRANDTFDSYYQLVLEPARQRIMFLRDGDIPAHRAFVQERPLAMRPGAPIRLRILIDGAAVVIYADDKVALSGRMYDISDGELGMMVTEGAAGFKDTQVRSNGN